MAPFIATWSAGTVPGGAPEAMVWVALRAHRGQMTRTGRVSTSGQGTPVDDSPSLLGDAGIY